ncbi:MAG: hypothetical protein HP492_07295 [Nitrospira sp.]|nr:hypothetical protein [Nitrospira sp.]
MSSFANDTVLHARYASRFTKYAPITFSPPASESLQLFSQPDTADPAAFLNQILKCRERCIPECTGADPSRDCGSARIAQTHAPGTLIVDVREPQEYAAGHVPGAINIPRGVIEFKIWNYVGYPANTQLDQPIVLQCQSGNRASLAAQSLADLGFTHINAVVMNLDDWQQSGRPFVK